MNPRYRWLLVGVATLALALAFMGRSRVQGAGERTIPSALAPARAVALTIGDKTIVPETIAVNKGERVTLIVTNRSAKRVVVALLGYEDRFGGTPIEAGQAVKTEILADRPGEDFAWLLNGAPAGHFIVAGSHLVEGHR